MNLLRSLHDVKAEATICHGCPVANGIRRGRTLRALSQEETKVKREIGLNKRNDARFRHREPTGIAQLKTLDYPAWGRCGFDGGGKSKWHAGVLLSR